MNAPDKIILHHSLTKDGIVADWEAITRYHMSYAHNGYIITKERALELIRKGESVKEPWSDNGYHFGIEKINNSYQCLVGRTLDRRGAHCLGQNDKSIGICFVGNFDDEAPPPTQLSVGHKLCRWLLNQYNLFPTDIYGHSRYANKTCPGVKFNIIKFQYEVRRRI